MLVSVDIKSRRNLNDAGSKYGLPPIAREDARILILGSFPGETSLATSQYYAHPRNQFWRLISVIIGIDLTIVDYSKRTETLQSVGIALWDVVSEAKRIGSLDQNIKEARMNALRKFVSDLPNLRAVAFNGKKAAEFAYEHINANKFEMLILPSSSPANTTDIAIKLQKWRELTKHLSGD